ncbi:MAG: HEPN domain-containing protein [Chitinophagaceae bacterium]|nr:MAG: HEPN domain-containing protein [Chitinophagaceae bacterium]
MEDKIENIESIIGYWRDSSDQDYETMQNLVRTKDYSWSLFIGHLVLEKLLKAVYVKHHQKHALFTHDLLRLATKTNLELTEEVQEWLDEISTFNLNARYDNYKHDFRKLCTKEFTETWVARIEKLRQWLISEL